MNFELTGKVIAVTGASSGIGRQIAITIALGGANVILIGRNAGRLNETLELMHAGDHQVIIKDLSYSAALDELTKQIPKLDGIVHSAGIVKVLPVKFINQAHISEIQRINYEVPVLLTQQLLKQKKINNSGSVVFIASIAAQIGLKGNALYAGTKGALTAVNKVFALELSSQKIRSNCILPGMIRTPMAETTSEVVSAESMVEHEKLYPLGFGEPQDVALATQFLLSDASRWITGTNLVIDGGYTAH